MLTAPTTAPADRHDTALCSMRGVDHRFVLPSGGSVLAIENITLDVQPSEVVCLLGPSGCGKSTIMRILAGLITPTHGEVSAHGRPMHGLHPSAAIVFQSFALFPWLTVEENVMEVLRAAGLPEDVVRQRADQAVRMVGLGGFEEAYPRELSGGMKQRAGMARALSLEPELLMLDEPFSQVDALTAESLRAEILDIWALEERKSSSILMVSHDIKEVVYMADRIVLLSANPGRIASIVQNPLPRPRDYRSAEFLRMVDKLHDLITGAELPDVPEEESAAVFEPLPDVQPGEVVGLLEYLDSHGGQGDVFRIAAELNREFGPFINVVKAAEMLDFVDTPRHNVVFTPMGRRFVSLDAEARQELWRESILSLRVMRHALSLVEGSPERGIAREILEEELALHLPFEDPEHMTERLVSWARFGNLLAYSDDDGMITLQE